MKEKEIKKQGRAQAPQELVDEPEPTSADAAKPSTARSIFNTGVKYFTSKPATAAITASALGIAGAPATIAAAITSGARATGVVIKVTADAVQAAKLNGLLDEYHLLVKYRDAKDNQGEILLKNPELPKILGPQLLDLQQTMGKKSTTERYDTKSQVEFDTKVYAKSVAKHAADTASTLINLATALTSTTAAVTSTGTALKSAFTALATATTSVPSALTALEYVGKAAGSVVGLVLPYNTSMSYFQGVVNDTKAIITVDKLREETKERINKERDAPDTPGYDNNTELAELARKQSARTKAIKELVNDPDYSRMSNSQIKKKFKEIKSKIEAKEPPIKRPEGIAKVTAALASITQSIIQSQAPGSDFNAPEQLARRESDAAFMREAKAMARQATTVAQKVSDLVKQIDKENAIATKAIIKSLKETVPTAQGIVKESSKLVERIDQAIAAEKTSHTPEIKAVQPAPVQQVPEKLLKEVHNIGKILLSHPKQTKTEDHELHPKPPKALKRVRSRRMEL